MRDGRAIVESQSLDGVLSILRGIKSEFFYVNATEPVQDPHGSYVSLVRFSNDLTIKEVRPECG